jgi:hypothetical protein
MTGDKDDDGDDDVDYLRSRQFSGADAGRQGNIQETYDQDRWLLGSNFSISYTVSLLID